MTTIDIDQENLSWWEQVALLPEGQQERLLSSMSHAEIDDPELWLRPDQLKVYHDDAPVVVYSAGRGSGKTRVGSSWCSKKAREMPGSIGHLVGRTVSDVRDVMVRGPAGIIATSPEDFVPEYVPSLRILKWPNGSRAYTFSSEEPSQLRGPQSAWTWVDELAALNHRPDDSGATTWDNVQLGTRLGAHPQILATTTPKRIKLMRELSAISKTSNRVRIFGGATFSNRANLSPEYLRNVIAMYKGTALERQELYGELLDIVEGALWQAGDIDVVLDWLANEAAISVIGVDPGLTTGGDATGIVTIRSTNETLLTRRRAAVVRDWTEPDLQPERWAARVVEAWRTEKDETGNVPIVVAESNAGGQLVAAVIEGVAGEREIPIALVPSTRSKAARAEPIVIRYRKGDVKHLHDMPELVEELTGWEPPTPGGSRGSGWSPNRLDAMVVALTACLVDDKPLRPFGRLIAGDTADVLQVPEERWKNGRGSQGGLGLSWRD